MKAVVVRYYVAFFEIEIEDPKDKHEVVRLVDEQIEKEEEEEREVRSMECISIDGEETFCEIEFM